MSLQTVCAAIAQIAADAGSGITTSHAAPPDVLGKMPASWVNPLQGVVTRTADEAMWEHTLELIVYVAPRAANLPAEFTPALPLVSSVERAFWDAWVNDSFDRDTIHNLTIARYQIGVRDFGGKPHIAVTFTLQVKEHTP